METDKVKEGLVHPAWESCAAMQKARELSAFSRNALVVTCKWIEQGEGSLQEMEKWMDGGSKKYCCS